MITGLNISIVIFALLSTIIIADDPCKYVHATKGTIDISSIGKPDGPAFKDQIPTTGSNYKYSYNPCRPFSEGAVCKDVAACQVSMDGLFTFPIAMQNTARWEVSGGLGSNPTVIYTAPEGKTTRVVLECKRSGDQEFEALGEEPINTYKFRLAHKCACWDGCGGGPGPQTSTGTPGGGGSGSSVGGTVFVVMLLVGLTVYFIGFAVFYRVREQKSGADLIAHRAFWGSLPGLVKDGAAFTVGKVTGKGSYSSV